MYASIGIIGGMGPAATCDLMNKIIQNTAAPDDQHHIHLYVDCNTAIPDRTAAILHGGADPLPELRASAEKLRAMGADLLIMPCNTAHYFHGALAEGLDIPLLHMPRETAAALAGEGVTRAALLATDGTVQSGVYAEAMADAGITLLYPDAAQQALVMHLIYGCVKPGRLDLLPRPEMAALLASLRARGAQRIILGCTELPIAFAGAEQTGLADPTLILARAAIRRAGAPLTE